MLIPSFVNLIASLLPVRGRRFVEILNNRKNPYNFHFARGGDHCLYHLQQLH